MKSIEVDHFVILSGAYVGSEIAAEFGYLPPIMLPIGGTRLYEHQISLARTSGARNVTISLPADYDLPVLDYERLKACGVRVVRVPTKLTLVQSLYFVLEVLNATGQVAVLHGDTLIDAELDGAHDVFFVSQTTADYDWGLVIPQGTHRFLDSGRGTEGQLREVICGFFLFSDGQVLRECCAVAQNFIDALNGYTSRINTFFVRPRQWLDLGHLNLYYTARRDLLVTRAFNSISYRRDRLVKASDNLNKMEMEISWYQNVPPALRHYLPQFFDSRQRREGEKIFSEYDIEYLYNPNIAELVIFGDIPSYRLDAIVRLCVEFLAYSRDFRPTFRNNDDADSFCANHFDFLIREKTRKRLGQFQAETNFDIDQPMLINGRSVPSPRQIAEDMISEILPTRIEHVSFWHGDFFFGNILYDARARAIRLVDPRGEALQGQASTFGDCRYDRAKLLHSLIGYYDDIIAGRCDFKQLTENEFTLIFDDGRSNLDDFAANATIGEDRLLTKETLAITVLLFLSMLPLHRENKQRQLSLLANAARLYVRFQDWNWSD